MLFANAFDPQTIPWWGAAIITALGAGGFSLFAKNYWQPFLDMFNKGRAERRKEEADTLSTLRSEIADLRKAYHSEITELKAENKRLEVRIALLETLQLNFPLPHWALDRQLRYIWVNGPFEEIILRPINKTAEGIRGQTSLDIFSTEVAAALARVTVEATRSSRGTATRTGTVFDDREEVSYTVCIWPVYRGNQHIGYEGLALPEPILAKRFEQNIAPMCSPVNLSLPKPLDTTTQ